MEKLARLIPILGCPSGISSKDQAFMIYPASRL